MERDEEDRLPRVKTNGINFPYAPSKLDISQYVSRNGATAAHNGRGMLVLQAPIIRQWREWVFTGSDDNAREQAVFLLSMSSTA
jgi:shikimate 5-dehydrogenase